VPTKKTVTNGPRPPRTSATRKFSQSSDGAWTRFGVNRCCTQAERARHPRAGRGSFDSVAELVEMGVSSVSEGCSLARHAAKKCVEDRRPTARNLAHSDTGRGSSVGLELTHPLPHDPARTYRCGRAGSDLPARHRHSCSSERHELQKLLVCYWLSKNCERTMLKGFFSKARIVGPCH
jgi:hypothetical protein